jgi:hypothetical protein
MYVIPASLGLDLEIPKNLDKGTLSGAVQGPTQFPCVHLTNDFFIKTDYERCFKSCTFSTKATQFNIPVTMKVVHELLIHPVFYILFVTRLN